MFEDDEKEYVHAQGYENFIQRLLKDFPDEESTADVLWQDQRAYAGKFPLYNLRSGGDINEKQPYWSWIQKHS